MSKNKSKTKGTLEGTSPQSRAKPPWSFGDLSVVVGGGGVIVVVVVVVVDQIAKKLKWKERKAAKIETGRGFKLSFNFFRSHLT